MTWIWTKRKKSLRRPKSKRWRTDEDEEDAGRKRKKESLLELAEDNC